VHVKSKLALAFLTISVFAAGYLPASEAVWEVLVSTELPAPAAVFPGPLPGPAQVPAEFLLADAVPVAVPQASLPVRLPGFRPSPRPGKAFFDANLVVMVGLNVADYLSTREALKYPGLAETNPLMKPFVKSPAAFAAAKLGTTALTYWSMKSLFRKNRTVAWIVTTASNAVLSVVVANNIRLIQGARAR
jgi:hypothetical protein